MICRGEVHGIIDDTHVIVGSYLYKWLGGKSESGEIIIVSPHALMPIHLVLVLAVWAPIDHTQSFFQAGHAIHCLPALPVCCHGYL